MPMIQTLIFSHILQQDSTLHANMNNAKILHTFLESFCNLLQSQNTTKKSLKALKIYVSGHVQGVGFRPFIYNLATKLHVCGYVRNTIDNVEILICPSAMHSKNNIMDTADVYDKQTFIEHEAFYKDSTIFLLSMLMACGYAMKIHEVQKDTMLSSLYKDAKAIMATIFIPKNAYIHALNMQIYYAIKNKENDMTNPTAQDDLEFVYHDFNIIESSYRDNSALHLQFPLDSKLCDTCFNDMNNTDSRFYKYAFSACVDCGARYSIIHTLPYDRNNTTMCNHPLCESCREDYANPHARRFHTEPISCNHCKISILSFRYTYKSNSQSIQINPHEETKYKNALNHYATYTATKPEYAHIDSSKILPHSIYLNHDAILQCAKALQSNDIVLFKGLGGFAFLANARSDDAIQQLRKLKNRPSKPFAIMAKLSTLQHISLLNAEMQSILQSQQSPILITLKSSRYNLSSTVSHLQTIGVMIPYSAMLTLLFESLSDDFVLVYTSANKKGNMIAKSLDELPIDIFTKQLHEYSGVKTSHYITSHDIVDTSLFILDYDRDIAHRLDDSIISGMSFYYYGTRDTDVLQHKISRYNTKHPDANFSSSTNDLCKHNHIVSHRNTHITSTSLYNTPFHSMRLSRGFTPLTLHFPLLSLKSLSVGFGAMQKSSLAFGKKQHIVLSPYMGDLFSIDNIINFRNNFDFFSSLFGKPEIFIVDKHTHYASTQIAQEIAVHNNAAIHAIFHHHAHYNALLLESQTQGVGVIFDGSGLGDDGTIWGGEFLLGNFKETQRIMSFKPFRILGGEKHITDSKRLALSYALCNNITSIIDYIAQTYSHDEMQTLQTMEKMGINAPLTSSVGRLFDIAGFILGLENLDYEGQSGEMIASLAVPMNAELGLDLHSKRDNIRDLESYSQSNKYKDIANHHIRQDSHHNTESTQTNAHIYNAVAHSTLLFDCIARQAIVTTYNPYHFTIHNGIIDMRECFIAMFADSQKGVNKSHIALRFIDTLAFCIAESLHTIGADYALFGGGVFANFMLCARLEKLLNDYGIGSFFPKLPCNDYSISLGQLAFAHAIQN